MTRREPHRRLVARLQQCGWVLCRDTFAALGTVFIVGVGLVDGLVQSARRSQARRAAGPGTKAR